MAAFLSRVLPGDVQRQAAALVRRNLLVLRRDYGGLYIIIVLPLVYVIVLAVLSKIVPASVPLPAESASRPMSLPLDGQLRTFSMPNPIVIAYTPQSSSAAARIASALVDPAFCTLCTFANATLLPLRDDKDVEDYIYEQKGPMHVAVEFRNLQSDGSLPNAGNAVEIMLRFNGSVVPSTKTSILPATTCRINNTCPALQYVTSGMLDMEAELAHALARELPGSPSLKIQGSSQFLPRAPLSPEPNFLKFMGPIFVSLAFWPFFTIVLKNIVMGYGEEAKTGNVRYGLAILVVHALLDDRFRPDWLGDDSGDVLSFGPRGLSRKIQHLSQFWFCSTLMRFVLLDFPFALVHSSHVRTRRHRSGPFSRLCSARCTFR